MIQLCKREGFKVMKKLEIGCGERPTKGFLHQDIENVSGIELDFHCAPYEIPDDNFDLIIAVGVMEHLRLEEFEKTVNHFLNILKNDGVFLFDVPDLKVWCQYYIDNCEGKNAPFDNAHVLSTIYGWQRWTGDEHKSGWSEKTIEELIKLTRTKESYFELEFSTPKIFKEIGLDRNRFNRDKDAHLYVKLTKKAVV